MLILGFFLINGVFVASSPPKGVGNPENITVQVIDSKTVEVFWSTSWENVERYDVTYNPTENRVVSQAAGDSRSIILRELRPNTQYQVTVTAVVGGKNYKSRRLVFRTSSDQSDELAFREKFTPTKPTKSKNWHPQSPEPINPDPTAVGSKNTPPTSTTVRGVEIGLVLLALCVWIIAIALFFHRWGKIRMLLPYQPDYKTQQSLKVPGTGATIVSGCTGRSNSQGHQEGPGCVQHLRWSSRYSEEAPAAKKCSPSRRQARGRVSSVVFPSSPSYFYSRTSAECEFPRMIRHAHSHDHFPTEFIPLCQVNQPRSDAAPKLIPITVNDVDEKTKNVKLEKPRESKVSERRDGITNIDHCEFFNKDKLNSSQRLLARESSCRSSFYDLQNFYPMRSLEEGEVGENEKESGRGMAESKARRGIDVGDATVQEVTSEHENLHRRNEKPQRYNRSSLKKQKIRLHQDPDSYPKVPIYEFDSDRSSQDKCENVKGRKSKDPKSAEMRRKAFLRKISLQDTYVNYNQDYWLDYKKSLRFHKSIDLGYLKAEEQDEAEVEVETEAEAETEAETEAEAEMNNSNGQTESSSRKDEISPSNQVQSSPIIKRSKLPLKFTSAGNLKKSDSDPVIFPRLGDACSCADCHVVTDATTDAEKTEAPPSSRSSSKSFALPSNDDIPLFLERNGLIETDFDVFDEISLATNHPDCGGTSQFHRRNFCNAADFSTDFYEIELNNDEKSESDKATKSKAFDFDFEGGKAFFETLPSTASDESDVFYNETDPLMASDGWTPTLPKFSSSSSPPKSTPG